MGIAGELETDGCRQLTRRLHHIIFIAGLAVLLGHGSAGVAFPHGEIKCIAVALRLNFSIREETPFFVFAQLPGKFSTEVFIRIFACALQQIK